MGPGLPPVLAGHHQAGGRLEAGLGLGGVQVQPPVHTEQARPVEAELLDEDALLCQPGPRVVLSKERDNLLGHLAPRSPAGSQLLLVLQPLEAHQAGVAALV